MNKMMEKKMSGMVKPHYCCLILISYKTRLLTCTQNVHTIKL